jgi:hypothetical protein
MEGGRTPPRPYERIVSTARDLFHRRGFRAVGIDTNAEVRVPTRRRCIATSLRRLATAWGLGDY